MPARIISSKIPNLSVPGPTVHTIFVRFIFPPMKAPPRLDLSFLIISMLVKAIYAPRNICLSTPFIYLLHVAYICLSHVARVLTLYVYCTSTEPSPRIASIALMDSSLGSKHIFGGKLMRFR